MFCVRVLEERAMSEKLFFVDKIFWHSVWDTSNLHNSPSAPNVMVMVISPLSLTTSCLSHLWRLLSFWPRLTLGLAAKRRLVTLCHVSAVTCHGRGWKEVLLQGRGEKDPGQRDGPGSVRLQDTAVGNQRNRYPVSTNHHTARSRLQQSQTFNKIWDIWAGADRRVISCQVLYEFQLLKPSTSAL